MISLYLACYIPITRGELPCVLLLLGLGGRRPFCSFSPSPPSPLPERPLSAALLCLAESNPNRDRPASHQPHHPLPGLLVRQPFPPPGCIAPFLLHRKPTRIFSLLSCLGSPRSAGWLLQCFFRAWSKCKATIFCPPFPPSIAF